MLGISALGIMIGLIQTTKMITLRSAASKGAQEIKCRLHAVVGALDKVPQKLGLYLGTIVTVLGNGLSLHKPGGQAQSWLVSNL